MGLNLTFLYFIILLFVLAFSFVNSSNRVLVIDLSWLVTGSIIILLELLDVIFLHYSLFLGLGKEIVLKIPSLMSRLNPDSIALYGKIGIYMLISFVTFIISNLIFRLTIIGESTSYNKSKKHHQLYNIGLRSICFVSFSVASFFILGLLSPYFAIDGGFLRSLFALFGGKV